MIARSSGSSGNPFFWPSDNRQVDEVSYFYENVFRSMFGMPKKSTLVIIAYGMGSWVAGTMSLLAGAKIAEKTNTTFITPGYNRKEVVEIVEKLGFYFEQIVICAYPPLLKEIIDTGLAMELDWTLYNIKYIFGAESISEEFRDYMHEVAGIKSSLMGSMNTIGSADAMVLGHETPVSIAVRRFLGQNDKVKLFNDNRMPTLAQYYPWQKDLFIQEDELILTVNSGVPLIRYNIHDNANIFQYDEINEKLKIAGTSTAKLVESVQSSSVNYDWKLPFVAIYGKSTNAVKFYGAFIYPENIKAALELPHNARVLSGKFLIKVGYDESHNQMIELTLEANMNRDPLGIDITKLKNDIVQTILKLNSEYVAVHNDIGEKSEPIISIVEYGNPNFKYTIKHKYTKD